jgi:hypothetical protein
MDEEQSPMPVYVVATRTDATRHALGVAQSLAKTRDTSVVIVVPPPEPIPRSSPETIQLRALITADAPDARVLLGPRGGLRSVSRILPRKSTIVLSGSIRHFLKTAEQHLAGTLATRGHAVVFLPSKS